MFIVLATLFLQNIWQQMPIVHWLLSLSSSSSSPVILSLLSVIWDNTCKLLSYQKSNCFCLHIVSFAKYSQPFRELRILAEGMLRNHLEQNQELTNMGIAYCVASTLWSNTSTLVGSIYMLTPFVWGAHDQDLHSTTSSNEAVLPYFDQIGPQFCRL